MGNKQAPAGPGGPGQGKRKPGSASSGGRNDNPQAARRAKVHLARNIPVEPAQSALKDGELDLQAFVAAHEFEIRSLEQSMATSKAVGSSRAFQQVPRGLRRRTASHNPRRVPRRLQARARKEMADDNTPMVQPRRRKPTSTRARLRAETAKRLRLLAARTRRRKMIAKGTKTGDKAEKPLTQRPRPKIRRNQLNEPPLPPSRFRKRQIHKTWLPTHLWHAKRARMTPPNNPLWRFAIPLTPSEKIYRPTHRSQGERGTLVWDTSYMSTIGLYGHEAGLSRVLKRLGFTDAAYWNGQAKKWLAGTRSRSATIFRDHNGRPRPMCPCTVLWNPQPAAQDESSTQRQVFLRMHPSAFKEVFDELLRLTRMETPRLYIEDLRFEIGSIELTGPASTEALLAVLTPHPAAEGSGLNQGRVFESLHGLTNPSALAASVTLAFTIQDPRLRYPPRRLEGWDNDRLQEKLMKNIVEWPVERQLDGNLLFDRNARHQGSALPSQQAICRRRSVITAGAFLKPTKSDPQIPVTLLACRSASGTQTQGSWTLMLPWKCVLPVWHSLVHYPLISGGNPRFAGVNESMQVAFERGVPWFPADYPGTDEGADWELTQRAKRRKDYDKRPKSKRTEWASLDLGAGRKGELGDGLTCDFELLFGLKPESREPNVAEASPGDAMQGVETTAAPGASNLNQLKLLNQVSKADLQSQLDATPTQALPANAITSVRIMIAGRGVVTSCARIYRLPKPCAAAPDSSNIEVPSTVPHGASLEPHGLPFNLRAQWLAKLSTEKAPFKVMPQGPNALDMDHRKRRLAQTLTAPPAQYPPPPTNHDGIGGHHPLVPDADDLIGFVTSGSYNMAHGRGTAVGAIAVEKVLADLRTTPKEAKLCIVRNAGENVGWLARWEHV
ncbi:Ribonuclease P/MRP, subunit POP1 [Akanthomyces lecanii RCEF 1005]|uniref:Ribonuclease P/MRP, subunit POP1 n=1 Tax=Akanthomyces lecanii RCEF 1005 TaxID=1081108 RepID=A0A168FJ18_CORDF|nr:Ribonuclease P/MRP, subunit POP1 [Akanthomyces lecanii RCEF 1005]